MFFFSIVTAPRFEEVNGKVTIDLAQDGKVALFRIRGMHKRKKRRRNSHGNFIPLDKDEPVYCNITIDGEVYKEIMTMKGGGLDMIREYNNNSKINRTKESVKVLLVDMDKIEAERKRRKVLKNVVDTVEALAGAEGVDIVAEDAGVRVQEDGAPGHGFNNRHGGKSTLPHDEMVAEALNR